MGGSVRRRGESDIIRRLAAVAVCLVLSATLPWPARGQAQGIVLLPNRGEAGSAFQVSGTGFLGADQVAIVWDGLATLRMVSPVAGSFTASVEVPRGSLGEPGPHEVAALAAEGSATATFVVTSPPPTTTTSTTTTSTTAPTTTTSTTSTTTSTVPTPPVPSTSTTTTTAPDRVSPVVTTTTAPSSGPPTTEGDDPDTTSSTTVPGSTTSSTSTSSTVPASSTSTSTTAAGDDPPVTLGGVGGEGPPTTQPPSLLDGGVQVQAADRSAAVISPWRWAVAGLLVFLSVGTAVVLSVRHPQAIDAVRFHLLRRWRRARARLAQLLD